MSCIKPTVVIPVSYERVDLPNIKLSHYPLGAETVTPVIVLTLNRPDKYNAFTPAMAQALEQLFKLFHHDSRVRVVVMTGAGKMFCAGSDLEVGFGKDKDDNASYRDMYVFLKTQGLHYNPRLTGCAQWGSSVHRHTSMPKADHCGSSRVSSRGRHDYDPPSRYTVIYPSISFLCCPHIMLITCKLAFVMKKANTDSYLLVEGLL